MNVNRNPPQVSLPPGWITATDPISGNLYYANPSTGQTSWQPPVMIIPPPPPPPPIASCAQPSFVQTTSFEMPVTYTINTTGLLIPSARAIINKSINNNSSPSPETNDGTWTDTMVPSSQQVPVELQMKAGMIADLANVQSNYRREQGQDEYSYEPLKPFELPISLSVEQTAESRLDVRLFSLMETLESIAASKT